MMMGVDMFSEKDMEDAIANNPSYFLGEEGLTLVSRQFRIGSYIFDLLFEDRHGAKLIVEIQKGTLDRNHAYKVLDYFDEYKESYPASFVELMVVANVVTRERQKRLSSKGISWKELPEELFLRTQESYKKDDLVEEAGASFVSNDAKLSVGHEFQKQELSGCSIDKYTSSIYIINTDSKSLGNRSPHDEWFKYSKAFTAGDYNKFGIKIMGKLIPGDLLIMYVNKVGAVGVGVVSSFWNKKENVDNQLVYKGSYRDNEYSIDVDWQADFRKNPISAKELIDANNGKLLNSAFISVTNGKNILELLGNYGLVVAGC